MVLLSVPSHVVRVFDDKAEAKYQKELLATLFSHFIFLQLLYCYYVDHNAVVFVPRCFLLVCMLFTTWLVDKSPASKRAGFIAGLHSPVFLMHIGKRPPSIFLNFLAEDDPFSLPRLFLMDVFVTVLVIVLANIRYSVLHDTVDKDVFQWLHFDGSVEDPDPDPVPPADDYASTTSDDLNGLI
mmetsp:Transcript_106767/g.184163  ORF Transcript_106767/g.184163 Transcript_106767/m.184163 type:complete len:183 (-) Transcript_106767:23-571(-)